MGKKKLSWVLTTSEPFPLSLLFNIQGVEKWGHLPEEAALRSGGHHGNLLSGQQQNPKTGGKRTVWLNAVVITF